MSDRVALDDMLDALKDAKRQGRPQAISEGSATSQLLGEVALKDKEHWDISSPDPVKALGIGGACSTVERVMHNHHAIFRRKPGKKPPLDEIGRLTVYGLLKKGYEFDKRQRSSPVMRCGWGSIPPRGTRSSHAVDKWDREDNGTIRVTVWAAIVKGFDLRLNIYEPDDIFGPEDRRGVARAGN